MSATVVRALGSVGFGILLLAWANAGGTISSLLSQACSSDEHNVALFVHLNHSMEYSRAGWLCDSSGQLLLIELSAGTEVFLNVVDGDRHVSLRTQISDAKSSRWKSVLDALGGNYGHLPPSAHGSVQVFQRVLAHLDVSSTPSIIDFAHEDGGERIALLVALTPNRAVLVTELDDGTVRDSIVKHAEPVAAIAGLSRFETLETSMRSASSGDSLLALGQRGYVITRDADCFEIFHVDRSPSVLRSVSYAPADGKVGIRTGTHTPKDLVAYTVMSRSYWLKRGIRANPEIWALGGCP